jgi:hypothetical protein
MSITYQLNQNIAQFGGHELVLAGRIVYWPSQGAMILSNLLAEPPAPQFDLEGAANSRHRLSRGGRASAIEHDEHWAITLGLLQDRLSRFEPTTVYCLEDNNQWKGGGDSALANKLKDARYWLRQYVRRHNWIWLTDDTHEDIGSLLGGQQAMEARAGGLVLRAKASLTETRPEISGYFQPTAKLQNGHLTLRHRCYVESDNRLILPAFGSASHGADVFADQLAALVGPNFTAHLLSEPDIFTTPSSVLAAQGQAQKMPANSDRPQKPSLAV